MKISLIIPIYKAEPFLPRLFENLEAQGVFFDDKEYGEVIFVNDGSPDNSESIILEYGKRHPWVRLIRQENQGQHIARNTGIKASEGDYIAFMDQDDAYTYNALQILVKAAEESGAEIIRGGTIWPREADYFKWRDYHDSSLSYKQEISGVDYLVQTNGLRNLSMVWAAVYSGRFIRTNSFYFETEFKVFEDGVYNWKIMPYAKRIIIINNIVYFWIQRESSDLHNSSTEHQFKRVVQNNHLAIFYGRLLKSLSNIANSSERLIEILSFEMNWVLFSYLGAMINRRGLTREEINPTIKRFKDEGIYPYPHSFPKNMPEGYPTTLRYKIMWKLMSYESILRFMLRIRTNKQK